MSRTICFTITPPDLSEPGVTEAVAATAARRVGRGEYHRVKRMMGRLTAEDRALLLDDAEAKALSFAAYADKVRREAEAEPEGTPARRYAEAQAKANRERADAYVRVAEILHEIAGNGPNR